jgi:hypothetical protein
MTNQRTRTEQAARAVGLPYQDAPNLLTTSNPQAPAMRAVVTTSGDQCRLTLYRADDSTPDAAYPSASGGTGNAPAERGCLSRIMLNELQASQDRLG